MITVNDLLTHYKTKRLIAKAFNEIRPCTPAAVSLWGTEETIPPQRELDMRLKILPGKAWPSENNKKVSNG